MKPTNCVLGILFFGLVCLGCSEPKHWYKSGATAATYERDKSDCEDMLIEAPPGGAKGANYSFETCMESKGWVVIEKGAM